MTDIYLFPVEADGDIVLRDISAPAPPVVADDVSPTIKGTLSATATASSITVDWSATTSSDNVAVARREYRLGTTGAYTAATAAEESSKKHTFMGLPASTPYVISIRCVDTSGNVSSELVVGISTTQVSPVPGGASNYIRCTLATRGGVLQVNLAVLYWSLFSKRPGNMGTPVAEGVYTMTPGSAEVKIAVPAATVPSGWYFLVLCDEDGTTALASPILVGP